MPYFKGFLSDFLKRREGGFSYFTFILQLPVRSRRSNRKQPPDTMWRHLKTIRFSIQATIVAGLQATIGRELVDMVITKYTII